MIDKVSRLTVLYELPKEERTRYDKREAMCSCSCGNLKKIRLAHLKRGDIKSCGCLAVDTSKEVHTTHGMSHTSEYSVWCGMKKRCYNSKERAYPDYGGRGIKVCDEWFDSFEAFFRDMGKKPSPDLSIDRINVNGNYEPSNCRWATAYEQEHNKRRHL